MGLGTLIVFDASPYYDVLHGHFYNLNPRQFGTSFGTATRYSKLS